MGDVEQTRYIFLPEQRLHCVYCAFGVASEDVEDAELRTAAYDEVMQPLERLLGRSEDV
jgi:hypothetical protein